MFYAYLRDVADLVVIRERPDGSGLVEIPILRTGTIDLARTATGTEGSVTFTRDDLVDIATNYASYPGPVPAGFVDHSEDRGGAQPAFVDAMRVEGDTLLATFDLNAWAFDQVVKQRAYRGFSIEGAKNLQKPTRSFEGWVVKGGLFTNQPAANVEYKVAAASSDTAEETVTVSFALARKGDNMPDPKTELALEEAVAQAKAEKKRADDLTAERDAANAKLQEATRATERSDAELSHANAKVRRLEAQVADLETDKAKAVAELSATKKKAAEAELSILDGQVRDRIQAAIDAGVSPAVFAAAREGDAATWFNDSFKSLEAFDAFLGAMPKTETPTIPSGRRKPTGKGSAVPPEEAARLARAGLDDEALDDITDATQLADLRASQKKD